MSAPWPQVPLGEVLSRSEEWETIEPTRRYREVTVRLWGKGVVLRKEREGSEIAASRRLRIHADEFILSRIDARNGAVGVVPRDLDGAVVSNDFPAYRVDANRLLPGYLGWLGRSKIFVNLCRRASEGTTNRVRLQEDRFLASRISLPPLPTQRRLANEFEGVSIRAAEAAALCRQVDEAALAACRSLLSGAGASRFGEVRLRDLVDERNPDIEVDPEELYQFAGVYCFGKGVFKGPRKEGGGFSYPRLTRLRAGDFVYPKLMAWEGALGMVPPECDGMVVSPEFPVFEVKQSRVLPEVLDIYFRTPSVWPRLAAASTGTNVRRRRLHPSAFLALSMRVPPMDVQRLIRDVQKCVQSTAVLHSQTRDDLDALFPSFLRTALSDG